MSLVIGNDTIGKNFRRLEAGKDVICSTDQYLSLFTGVWEASTTSRKEGYTNPNNASNYRRAVNLKGFFIILPKFLKRKWGICWFNLRKRLYSIKF